jgi:hypothetical protein
VNYLREVHIIHHFKKVKSIQHCSLLDCALAMYCAEMTERDMRAPAGVAFRDLDVFGYGSPTDYQKTFGNYPISFLKRLWTWRRKKQIRILRNIEGVARSCEMILVLGRPGSGCTTFLKTLGGQTDGLAIGEGSVVNYHGEHWTKASSRV